MESGRFGSVEIDNWCIAWLVGNGSLVEEHLVTCMSYDNYTIKLSKGDQRPRAGDIRKEHVSERTSKQHRMG